MKDKEKFLFIFNNGGLEHLKMETRLINEMFPSVISECYKCVILTPQVRRLYSK